MSDPFDFLDEEEVQVETVPKETSKEGKKDPFDFLDDVSTSSTDEVFSGIDFANSIINEESSPTSDIAQAKIRLGPTDNFFKSDLPEGFWENYRLPTADDLKFSVKAAKDFLPFIGKKVASSVPVHVQGLIDSATMLPKIALDASDKAAKELGWMHTPSPEGETEIFEPTLYERITRPYRSEIGRLRAAGAAMAKEPLDALHKESEDRLKKALDEGGLPLAISEQVAQTAANVSIDLLALRALPLSGAHSKSKFLLERLKTAAPDIAKASAYAFATTPGDETTKAKSAAVMAGFFATPAAFAGLPNTASAILASIGANAAITTAAEHKQISDIVNSSIEQAKQAGEPNLTWAYVGMNLIPVYGPDVAFGLMSRSIKAEQDRLTRGAKPNATLVDNNQGGASRTPDTSAPIEGTPRPTDIAGERSEPPGTAEGAKPPEPESWKRSTTTEEAVSYGESIAEKPDKVLNLIETANKEDLIAERAHKKADQLLSEGKKQESDEYIALANDASYRAQLAREAWNRAIDKSYELGEARAKADEELGPRFIIPAEPHTVVDKDAGEIVMSKASISTTGMDAKRSIEVTSGNMYDKPVDETIPKELLQNSLDAIKDSPTKRIDYGTDDRSNTLYLRDHGKGLSPTEVIMVYLRGFSSDKTAGNRGGFGLAKSTLLTVPIKFKTIFFGKNEAGVNVKTTVTGKQGQWLDFVQAGSIDAKDDLYGVDQVLPGGITFRVDKEAGTGFETWIQMPTKKPGETDESISVNSSNWYIGQNLDNVRIPGLEVNMVYLSAADPFARPEKYNYIRRELKIDKNKTLLKPQSVYTVPGAEISVYYDPSAPIRRSWSIKITNGGLPQFQRSLDIDAKLPSELSIEVTPTAGTLEADYPYTLNRDGLKGPARAKVDEIVRTLANESKKIEINLLTKIYDTAPTLWQSKKRFIDLTQRVPSDVIKRITDSTEFSYLAKILDNAYEGFKKAVKEYGIPYSAEGHKIGDLFQALHFDGFAFGGGFHGVRVGTIVEGSEGRVYHDIFADHRLVSSILKRYPEMPAAQAWASHIVGVMHHEFAHQISPSEGETHAKAMTGLTGPLIKPLFKVHEKLLEFFSGRPQFLDLVSELEGVTRPYEDTAKAKLFLDAASGYDKGGISDFAKTSSSGGPRQEPSGSRVPRDEEGDRRAERPIGHSTDEHFVIPLVKEKDSFEKSFGESGSGEASGSFSFDKIRALIGKPTRALLDLIINSNEALPHQKELANILRESLHPQLQKPIRIRREGARSYGGMHGPELGSGNVDVILEEVIHTLTHSTLDRYVKERRGGSNYIKRVEEVSQSADTPVQIRNLLKVYLEAIDKLGYSEQTKPHTETRNLEFLVNPHSWDKERSIVQYYDKSHRTGLIKFFKDLGFEVRDFNSYLQTSGGSLDIGATRSQIKAKLDSINKESELTQNYLTIKTPIEIVKRGQFGRHDPKDDTVPYHLGNLDEFLVGVFVDRGLQKKMANIPSEVSGNLWQTFVKVLKDLLRFMKVPIQEPSLLDKAIQAGAEAIKFSSGEAATFGKDDLTIDASMGSKPKKGFADNGELATSSRNYQVYRDDLGKYYIIHKTKQGQTIVAINNIIDGKPLTDAQRALFGPNVSYLDPVTLAKQIPFQNLNLYIPENVKVLEDMSVPALVKIAKEELVPGWENARNGKELASLIQTWRSQKISAGLQDQPFLGTQAQPLFHTLAREWASKNPGAAKRILKAFGQVTINIGKRPAVALWRALSNHTDEWANFHWQMTSNGIKTAIPIETLDKKQIGISKPEFEAKAKSKVLLNKSIRGVVQHHVESALNLFNRHIRSSLRLSQIDWTDDGIGIPRFIKIAFHGETPTVKEKKLLDAFHEISHQFGVFAETGTIFGRKLLKGGVLRLDRALKYKDDKGKSRQGGWVRAKASDLPIFNRFPTPEMYTVLANPELRRQLADKIAIMKGNSSIGATPKERSDKVEMLLERAWRESQQGFAPLEIGRLFKEIPYAIRIEMDGQPLQINLYDTDLSSILTRLVHTMTNRMAFIGTFHPFDSELNVYRNDYNMSRQLYEGYKTQNHNEAHRMEEYLRLSNGLPGFIETRFLPGSWAEKLSRAGNSAMTIAASGMLHKAWIPNLYEPLGLTGATFGYKALAKSYPKALAEFWHVASPHIVQHITRIGGRTIFPSRLVPRRGRMPSDIIRSVSSIYPTNWLLKAVNEFNEIWSAASALERVKDWQGEMQPDGSVKQRILTEDWAALASLDFTDAEIRSILSGKAPQPLYDAVVQRASSYTQNSNLEPEEMNRINAGSPFLGTPIRSKTVFKFQNYFAGQLRNIIKEASLIQQGTPGSKTLLTKNVLGSVASGILSTITIAAATAGVVQGIEQSWKWAKNHWLRFFIDSILYNKLGGPWMTLGRNMSYSDESLFNTIANISVPASVVSDLYDLGRSRVGKGSEKYKGVPALEAATMFITSKSSDFPIVPVMAATFGLTDEKDFELEKARKAYWRWYYNSDLPKSKQVRMNEEEEDIKFRKLMSKAGDALMSHSEQQDFYKYLTQALVSSDRRPSITSINQSLENRKFVNKKFSNDPVKDLKIKQELKDNLIDDYYQLLVQHDNLITAIQKELKAIAPLLSVKEPEIY